MKKKIFPVLFIAFKSKIVFILTDFPSVISGKIWYNTKD